MKNKLILFLIILPLLISCGKKDKLKIDVIDPKTSKNFVRIDEKVQHRNVDVEKFKVLEKLDDNRSFAYPSIEILNNKDILLFAMMSENKIDDFSHGSIIYCRSNDKGESWVDFNVKSLDFPGSINVYGPSVKKIKNGNLLLVYGVKYSANRCDIYYEISSDDGLSWTNPKVLNKPNLGYQILNNHRIEVTSTGRIIVPVSYPANGDFNSYWKTGKGLIAFYYYSDDNGITWEKSIGISSPIAIFEPGIVNISNHELLMNLRTDVGKVLFARSYDYGLNWEYEETNIKSPSSPQTVFKYRNNLIMVWNNTSDSNKDHGGNRSPLTMAFSDDKGRNWKSILELENKDINFDYAYSGILADNKYLYVAYNERVNSKHKLSVKIARIKLTDLEY